MVIRLFLVVFLFLASCDNAGEKLIYSHRFVVRWKGTDIPVANMRYRILNAEGRAIMEGCTNENGEIALSSSEMPTGLSLSIKLFGN